MSPWSLVIHESEAKLTENAASEDLFFLLLLLHPRYNPNKQVTIKIEDPAPAEPKTSANFPVLLDFSSREMGNPKMQENAPLL